MLERHFSGDSTTPDRSEYYTRAVRSDGSEATVFRRQGPNGKWYLRSNFRDLTEKRMVSVDSSTESLTTYPLSDSAVAFYRSWPKSECAGKQGLERSNILGYDVLKVPRDLPGPPGTTTHLEAWEAPALDCFQLSEYWTMTSNGQLTDRIVREAVAIAEGGPSAASFEPPPGYTERAPSEVSAEHARRFGGQPAFSEPSATELDKAYQSSRTSSTSR